MDALVTYKSVSWKVMNSSRQIQLKRS